MVLPESVARGAIFYWSSAFLIMFEHIAYSMGEFWHAEVAMTVKMSYLHLWLFKVSEVCYMKRQVLAQVVYITLK